MNHAGFDAPEVWQARGRGVSIGLVAGGALLVAVIPAARFHPPR